MGFAKYHEDDLKIYDDRMYYHKPSMLSNEKFKIKYKEICPLCRTGFKSCSELIEHVLASHGGVHEFVVLNNMRMDVAERTVSKVYSLKIYCFRDSPWEIQLRDEKGETHSFWTKVGIYEYDIQSIMQSQLYSELQIDNIDKPVCIKQQLDINLVTIDKIFSGKYISYLFDEQFSEEKLSVHECLIYLKMLIYEGSDTEGVIERIGCMDLDASRELEELYYYHFLRIGSVLGIEDKIPDEIAQALLALLNGKYSEANTSLSGSSRNKNDRDGCKIILGLLKNDKQSVKYLVNRYEPYGFIGILEEVLYYFAMYENEESKLIDCEINELKLFEQYPLIKAIVELNDAIHHYSRLSSESYRLLRELTPLAAIHYCYSIDDSKVKEKVLKIMVRTHENSALLKEHVLQNNYKWMKRRIFVSDGELYRRAVIKENEMCRCAFSRQFIDSFPFDDQIQITPLGGEQEIGASCFVISYKGYNIMLDCGINVQKYGDAAYPNLDKWGREIDTIIVSHAHIDHSGGVPKAHAMWPEANIISTAPTKVVLKYLYSDMAKVKNGIVDEFEIENITIEKDVMLDTLNSINTVDYEEWINISKKIKFRLHPAGHIIGAAMIELQVGGKIILYTGDFCNHSQILTGDFDLNALPQNVDYLITEATYYKKQRIDWNSQYEKIKSFILKGNKAHRAILLPAVSVGRSQELVCLLGEMKLAGEISEEVPLYLAGMAIPVTTQIVPFMNERYAKILELFEEFDGISYPKENAIVIASSGSMSKGSAAYKIAHYWDNQQIKYNIITNGYLDENLKTEGQYIDNYSQVQRLSLSTHADLCGIFELIDYVSPKVISFVHRGKGTEADVEVLINTCKEKFSNDIVCKNLHANQSDKIFDLYEWLMEGAEE